MTASNATGARLRRAPGNRSGAGAVVLLLHGGAEERDIRPVPRWWPPVLRMWGFAPALLRSKLRPSVYLLRNPARGWNGGALPIADTRRALTLLRGRHPGRPIVLIGHSMGARVAAAVVADPDIAGFVGLAPWLPPDAAIPDLAGRRVLLVHAAADRDMSADGTRLWALRASDALTAGSCDWVRYLELPRAGHAMLRSFRRWHRMTAAGVEQILAGR